MTAQQYFDSILGRHIDYDGIYGAQCVDIIKKYFPEVLGTPAIRNNAKDYWTNYPSSKLTRIANTPSFLPKRGDIMVWGTAVGKYGHIAIIDTANLNTFVSVDQNWPFDNGTGKAHRQSHNYSGVLGVLRPKRDVNFDKVAYDAMMAEKAAQAARDAQKAKEEAERVAKLAEEEAKALADKLAKEKALADKIEQERLAKEQIRLEEEILKQKEANKNNIIEAFIKMITDLFSWLKGNK